MSNNNVLWWERDGLGYDGDGRLLVAGRDVATLARASGGIPLYLYDGARVEGNIARLRNALSNAQLRHRLFYAMKSNRFMPLLSMMKSRGLCGIDACSPREVVRARQCGFEGSEISFTATSLSNDDLRAITCHQGLIINCDSLSSIRRLAALGYCGRIGIRINPGTGIGYSDNDRLRYAGAEKPTKFGIYLEEFPAALELAKEIGLEVNGLHFHAGCGFLTPQLDQLERVFTRVQAFLALVPNVEYIDIGGGLGIPLVESDAPLDLELWAATVARHFGNTEAEIWVEPGDYIGKDAGVLVLQVNTVEQKSGHTFVGVNGGFNIHIEPAFYDLPLEIVPVRLGPNQKSVLASSSGTRVTVAGNINEALDIFAEDLPLPTIREGDLLALLNSGGYGSSMSSNHCMRGEYLEQLII
ncbi:MAG: diaminopimelate decarboxylase [Verrucomicrobiae bacterium]|nr:diaminopimelate decarboxylase [Verrucomicrobiae bacterium]